MAPTHPLNQCLLLINQTSNTFQWNFSLQTKFIQAFVNDVCQMAAILFRPQYFMFQYILKSSQVGYSVH